MSDLNVLVVEDELDGQQVVSRLLGKIELTTESVGTAEEAINRLQESRYLGAVIDLALPGMDGIQLIHAIRRNPETATLPCIAITAYHSSKVKKEVMDAGFNAYFAKPLETDTFARDLVRFL